MRGVFGYSHATHGIAQCRGVAGGRLRVLTVCRRSVLMLAPRCARRFVFVLHDRLHRVSRHKPTVLIAFDSIMNLPTIGRSSEAARTS